MNRIRQAAMVLLPLAMLAGCGVDGEPLRPEPREKRDTAASRLSGQSYFGYTTGKGFSQNVVFNLDLTPRD